MMEYSTVEGDVVGIEYLLWDLVDTNIYSLDIKGIWWVEYR